MTPLNQEFSNEFDILYNNIMSNQAPGLDEYEKSVLLTRAQEEVVKSLYSGKNTSNDSFEKTEEVRRYLDNLIRTYKTSEKILGREGLSKDSVFYNLPKEDNLWFITYESALLEDENLGCMNNREVTVVPTTQDDYSRTIDNPFRGPNKNRVLRLDSFDSVVELISKYNIKTYTVRYLSRPTPIILENLTDGLTINGLSNESQCNLNPVIHRYIIAKAVELASALYK